MSTARKETTGRTLLVALVLCIVCSVIVAGAAVSLKPVQTSNKQ
ncbi:MAG TPA: Na(+)-translocating NADH-quinone reductase subunit C, partial [Pseudomonadales bacterium]|nr:Na(+)-translocating NADH-quinone reductase subunit C [Pseudomonadales bacterium]